MEDIKKIRETKCPICGKKTTYRKTIQLKNMPIGFRICRTHPRGK